MKFELLRTLDPMMDLYSKPLTLERFQDYLKLLQGDSKDLVFPATGFNPMAKEHVQYKLKELEKLNAEKIMEDVISEFNSTQQTKQGDSVFKVALNLLDDAGGGWTNRYTSDYHYKFRLSGYFNRCFSIVIFWATDHFTEALIHSRCLECLRRTKYWSINKKPVTLLEHVAQEKFVFEFIRNQTPISINSGMTKFYLSNKASDDYNKIFNFLYGDNAAASLGMPVFGNPGIYDDPSLLTSL